MDAPAISSLSPSSAETLGGVLVRIIGARFQTPPAAPAYGKTTAPLPSVRVTFGGVVAEKVYVVSSTELWAIAPAHAASDTPVDVFLENMGQDGQPVLGEYVTKPAAFTYRRADLTKEGSLVSAVRALLRLLKTHVLPVVVNLTNTDYDDSTADARNIVANASLPCLVLAGPAASENRLHGSPNAARYETVLGEVRASLPPPRTFDLIFQVTAMSDNTAELLNIVELLTRTIGRLLYLPVPRDPANPAGGSVQFELDYDGFDAPPDVGSTANKNNVRQAQGVVIVRAVPIETHAARGLAARVGEATLNPGAIGPAGANVGITYDATPDNGVPGETR